MTGREPARCFYVSGVCCSTEEILLRKKLDSLAGQDRYSFNPITGELIVRSDVRDGSVIETLRTAGFGVRTTREVVVQDSFMERHRDGLLLCIAALFAAAGFFADYEGVEPLIPRGLFLLSILVGGWNVFRKAWISARSLALDMNFLMAVAVIGAIAIDRWAEGASVILLFDLSLVLESYSITRTRKAIEGLMANAPEESMVLRDGKEEAVLSRDVHVGETVIVRPGERVALDGVVVSGESTVVQAAITGEPTPVSKGPGTEVLAGSMNERGVLRIRVTRGFGDSALARIIHLVEEAQGKRAPVQLFVDRFARVYTPAVFGLSVVIALVPPLALGEAFGDWFYRALVLLVIACPCALVISTPVTIVSAITSAAKRGILIKGGTHLETLSRVKAVAFDKTGTLTRGKPEVTDIVPLNSVSREETLRIAAALELHSEHHLASAVLTEAERSSVRYTDPKVTEFRSFPGKGVEANVDGTVYFLGSLQFCQERGCASSGADEVLRGFHNEGKTGIVIGTSAGPIAVLGLRDVARSQSSAAIRGLKDAGIGRMILLSGDQEKAVRSVADEVGLAETVSAQLPEQKVGVVEDLKKRYGTVAMVGDGVNDAPALATSSVGIAMGVSGTDAALETADVVLVSDDIGKLPLLFGLSRKAMSVVKQNIALALVMKGAFLLMSIAGVATLWMAVLADDGTAIAVIVNGLRLLAFGSGNGGTREAADQRGR